MSKYPKVNYIGNKEKLVDWIIEKFPLRNGTVLDLFCGGCSVSYALKKSGYNVISNDVLYSNYVIAKAIVENDEEHLYDEDVNVDLKKEIPVKEYNQIAFLIDKLYFENEVEELAYLMSIEKNLKGYKKYLFLALLRRSMIRKIPYSRMNIKWTEITKLRDEEYSYKKYGRYRHYHNITFMEHIKDNLKQYNDAVLNNGTNCIATNYDAADCLSKLKHPIDIVYMDPPYPSTMNKYVDFYGPFDKIFDKNIKIKTELTDKNTFLENFSHLIELCVGKAKYVAISMNNRSYPSVETLVQHISCYIDNYTFSTKTHAYKVTGKENKKINEEILLVCKMKETL